MNASNIFYLPWTQVPDQYEKAIRLGGRIAREAGFKPAFIVPSKGHLPAALKGEVVISPRSGSVPHGSMPVLLHPNLRMLTRYFRRAEDPVLVVDHHPNDLETWGEVYGATNVLTGEKLQDPRSNEIKRIHDGIAEWAYNGLFSPPSKDTIDGQLRKLNELGWLDEHGLKVLTYALVHECDDEELDRLKKRVERLGFGK